MKKVFEVDRVCPRCDGTGLYVGMAERNGAAIVCRYCGGTGKDQFRLEYEPFKQRKEKRDVQRVYQTNLGIGIGIGNGHTLESFGGMPFKEWEAGMDFPRGSEMREYTCPAWWYQSVDYDKKPEWSICGWGTFSQCKHFQNKERCWKRWDKENT